MAAVTGGNNICHCVHVTEMNTRLVAIESWKRAHDVIHERGHDPLLKSGWQPTGSSPSGAPGGDPAGGAAAPTPAAGIGPSSTPTSLPLDLKGPLMAIAWKDRPLLDEKMALHDDFRFNGVKGGPEWKDNVEKAIISKAPVMRIILNWVEEMDAEPISEALFLRAVGTRLTEEQVQIVNASIWGFLAKAVSGPAQTIFNSAEVLNGLDAWRRVIVFISSGKNIMLDNLRREVKVLHLRQTPSL